MASAAKAVPTASARAGWAPVSRRAPRSPEEDGGRRKAEAGRHDHPRRVVEEGNGGYQVEQRVHAELPPGRRRQDHPRAVPSARGLPGRREEHDQDERDVDGRELLDGGRAEVARGPLGETGQFLQGVEEDVDAGEPEEAAPRQADQARGRQGRFALLYPKLPRCRTLSWGA